jgi:2-methylisocitrate lyase-like PEP mutase family enzyme
MMSQNETALAFRALHHAATPLLLANAWDAGTARLVEGLGAKAVATTSAGVAWSHGYPDGDLLPIELLVASVSAIARMVRIPLSVDIEGGYSDDPDMVERNIARVIEAGGVGINIEDGAAPPALLSTKIERARRAADRAGVPLYVNARTDVYLKGLVPAERRLAETLARAAQYRAAGADGIFVPGLTEPAAIREVAGTAGLPLNLLAWPGLPDLATLTGLGVKRISAGSGITQYVYGRAAAIARDFLRDGPTALPSEGSMPYAEINGLMAGR